MEKEGYLKKSSWLPYVLLTLTVLFWSGNFILGRGIRQLIPPVSLNFWRWIGAMLILLPFGLKNQGGFSLTPASLASLVYVALFPSVLSFIFWNYGVDKVGANRAGIFIHLMPVFSIILAILFLGERMRGFHAVGMLLIFSGILLATLPRRNERILSPHKNKLS